MKLAIPTKGDKGLEDTVSNVFGKAPTFTILEIDNGSVVNVEVVENPAASYKHGSGPIAIKTLADIKVDVAAANELGIGASTLLEMHKIRKFTVKPNTTVKDAVQKIIEELSEQTSK